MRSDKYKKKGLFGKKRVKAESKIDFFEEKNPITRKGKATKPKKSTKFKLKSDGRRADQPINESEKRVKSFEDLEVFEREYEKKMSRFDKAINNSSLKNEPKSQRKRIKASTVEKEAYLAARNLSKEEKTKKKKSFKTSDREYLDDNFFSDENKRKKKKGKRDIRREEVKKHRKGGCLKAFIMLLLLAGVLAAGFYFYLDSKVSKMQHVHVAPHEFRISHKAERELADYRNVAVLGIDARKGESYKGTRSDAIIIISLNRKTDDVNLISVMRDTYVPMKSMYGQETWEKITHAHAYGGAVNTCASLNRCLDLNIEEFIVMDWKSVADTVDQMGGITVRVMPNELRDLNKWGPETARNTNRVWRPMWNTGRVKLDGAQAATYCRIRKTSGGDPGRTKRMKKVMIALLREAKSDPLKVDGVLDKVLPEIQTNMDTRAITSLVPKLASFDIKKSIGWPYEYYGGIINGTWLAVTRTMESNVQKLHRQAFGQKNYRLSHEAKQISNLIIQKTAIQ